VPDRGSRAGGILRSFELPWEQAPTSDGRVVFRPVVNWVFVGQPKSEGMLVDTGADLSVAPLRIAERLGVDDSTGERITMRGVSQKEECKIEGSVVEVEIVVLPAGWRMNVPVFFADADVPLLAGRRGFLDRLHLTVNGPRKALRLARP